MYNTFTTFSITMYFLYILGSILTNSSVSLSFNIMIDSSSYSVRIYAPAISIVVTSLNSCDSMGNIIIIASRNTFRDVKSSCLCMLDVSNHWHMSYLQSCCLSSLSERLGLLGCLPCNSWIIYWCQ